jgi:glycosyltransferase involved in cell wall biosynthesis
VHILLTIHAPWDPDSGAPGVTADLGAYFRAQGHSVDHLSFNDMPRRVGSRAAGFLFPFFLARRIARMQARRPIDVIDASSGDLWAWASLRRRGAGGPLLVTRSHGLEHTADRELREDARRGAVELSWKYPLYYGGFRLWEVARSLRLSDIALFLNKGDLEYAVAQLGIPREKAGLTVNGAAGYFHGLPFTPLAGSAGDGIRIAQIGSYIPRKGIAYGAAALNGVLERHPSVSVTFLGTQAPPEQVLADFDPTVRERVKVVPTFKRDQLPELLRNHHVKLLPTTFEGFSVSLIEAMACGLAPVTTSTPGPMEIVRDGVNGVLVPPRDSAALANALERLIGDHSLLDRLRSSAHETAQRYTWERVGEETLALYREGLERKEPSSASRP